MTEWDELDSWWEKELIDDVSYHAQVRPLLVELLNVEVGRTILDLGTGTGWVLEELTSRGCIGIGVELNPALGRRASAHGPIVLSRLPDMSWCRSQALDGVTAVLVLEHIEDIVKLFHETLRVTRRGGTFTLVINHPQITAPGSSPVVDAVDGEVFWRWGEYLNQGSTEEPIDDDTVTFFHRPVDFLLNAAAGAGWNLEYVIERGMPRELADGDALLELQRGLPRLLGVRWRRI